MNTQSQVTGSFTPTDPPLKRKRGRPRKDESLVHGDSTPSLPGFDCMKKFKHNMGPTSAIGGEVVGAESAIGGEMVGSGSAVGCEMVGQVVSGVIEGSFDAGYFLKVRVGNTDSDLRGVVFLPGRFIPVTASNDVAPEAKMHRRTELPIPVSNLPIQQGLAPLPEQNDKQPLEPTNPSSRVQDQELKVQLQSSVQTAPENRTASTAPPLTDNLPTSTGCMALSLAGNAMPPKILEFGTESPYVPVIEKMGHDNVVKPDEVSQDLEIMVEKVSNVEAETIEQPKSVPQSASSVDIYPDTENVMLELQIQHQAANNNLEPNHSVHDGVKSVDIELSCAPAISEPGILSSEPIELNMWMEKQSCPNRAATPEILMKNSAANDANHLHGNPASHAANMVDTGLPFPPMNNLSMTLFEREAISSSPRDAAERSSIQKVIETQFCTSSTTNFIKAGSDLAPMTSLPVSLFEREGIPSDSKIAAAEPVLPIMLEPQLCSSSSATSNVECSITDAVPPTES